MDLCLIMDSKIDKNLLLDKDSLAKEIESMGNFVDSTLRKTLINNYQLEFSAIIMTYKSFILIKESQRIRVYLINS